MASTAEVYVDPAVGHAGEDLRQELEALVTEGPGRVYVIFPTYEGLALQIRVDGGIPSDAKRAVVDYVNNVEGGGTLNAVEGSTIAPGRPAKVPHLKDVTVQTEPDATGHQHEVQLSPHDYWSGNFTLPTETHTHEVEDWVVRPADGHQHVSEKRTSRASRAGEREEVCIADVRCLGNGERKVTGDKTERPGDLVRSDAPSARGTVLTFRRP